MTKGGALPMLRLLGGRTSSCTFPTMVNSGRSSSVLPRNQAPHRLPWLSSSFWGSSEDLLKRETRDDHSRNKIENIAKHGLAPPPGVGHGSARRYLWGPNPPKGRGRDALPL